MRDPTPAEVRAFYAALAPRFRARVERKQTSDVMHAVAAFLERTGRMRAEVFLERFVTTIPAISGPEVAVVYVPFEVGVPVGNWSTWNQVTVLPHELVHAEQIAIDGALPFSVAYLASATERTFYEAPAYSTAIWLSWWRTQTIPDLDGLADHLWIYDVREKHVQTMRAWLGAEAVSVRHGAQPCRQVEEAITLLSPELRA